MAFSRRTLCPDGNMNLGTEDRRAHCMAFILELTHIMCLGKPLLRAQFLLE